MEQKPKRTKGPKAPCESNQRAPNVPSEAGRLGRSAAVGGRALEQKELLAFGAFPREGNIPPNMDTGVRAPAVPCYPFLGEGSPTKTDYTSPLEDLV